MTVAGILIALLRRTDPRNRSGALAGRGYKRLRRAPLVGCGLQPSDGLDDRYA